jgi:hypothetical protein
MLNAQSVDVVVCTESETEECVDEAVAFNEDPLKAISIIPEEISPISF